MSKNKSGSFKPKRVYFSQVSNYALRDNKLSLKAKGLYSLIQSYITIENFILYKSTLKKVCLEGKTSFESGWKELKDRGYLLQERHQNSDGTFYYLYDLLDVPDHTPKTKGVDNAGSGKEGLYNKTDFNNTELNNTKKLHFLKGTENDFIIQYLETMKRFGYHQKRVTEDNLNYITHTVEMIELEGISLEDWNVAVEEYFNELPEGRDGDILLFLKGIKRHLDIDLE